MPREKPTELVGGRRFEVMDLQLPGGLVAQFLNPNPNLNLNLDLDSIHPKLPIINAGNVSRWVASIDTASIMGQVIGPTISQFASLLAQPTLFGSTSPIQKIADSNTGVYHPGEPDKNNGFQMTSS